MLSKMYPNITEASRFSGVLKDRLCLMYDLGEIGNETHFMLYCAYYDEMRDILFCRMSLIPNNLFYLDDHEKLNFASESNFPSSKFPLYSTGKEKKYLVYIYISEL